MKHLRKWNEDYLSKLKGEKQLSKDFERGDEERIASARSEHSGKHLPKLKSDKENREGTSSKETEKKEIVQKVIDGLTAQLNNKPGYASFKQELLTFLGEFPKE